MFRGRPLTCPDEGQPRAVEHEMEALAAYAFIELIRGLVATSPNEWQFVVSTCEQRLFDLLKKKCSRLPSGAVFYEFLGMTDRGPIVERR